jgi:death on curing protein
LTGLPKNKPRVFRLSAAFIEYLHDEVVSVAWHQTDPVFAGEYRDHRLVESAANRPFQSAFEQDAYPTLIEKAAALFHSLIANHCFHNGNKRTAVIALDCFLLANGIVLIWSPTDTYELARMVASYRERGESHEQVLREIAEAIEQNADSLSELSQYPPLRTLHLALLRNRRYIREHPLNRRQKNLPA